MERAVPFGVYPEHGLGAAKLITYISVINSDFQGVRSSLIYTSESEVLGLVDAFHKRMLSPTKWDNIALLTVTLYYGIKFPYAIAFELLKEGLQWVTLNAGLATENQHDISIHFWQTVKSFAIKYRNIDDLPALANILIATHRESAVPYGFSQEALFETEAALLTNTQADPATIEVAPLAIAPQPDQAIIS